jgi:hypothetical protein
VGTQLFQRKLNIQAYHLGTSVVSSVLLGVLVHKGVDQIVDFLREGRGALSIVREGMVASSPSDSFQRL